MSTLKNGAAMGLVNEAMKLLHRIAGPEKKNLILPMSNGSVAVGGSLLLPEPVPLGWRWTVKRWSWTCDAGGAVTAILYRGNPDRGQVVEVSVGQLVPGQTYAAYADSIGNNAILESGEPLSIAFFGNTAGGMATARLQVEAERLGHEPKPVDNFHRTEYEDAPPEEHHLEAHTEGNPVAVPHWSNLFRRS